MQAVISLLFSIIPVAIYLWIILAMDRYDREPLGLVLANFGWGILCAVLLLAIHLFEGHSSDILYRAPIIEEALKASFLFWTASRKAFDNITDGLVYGMAIGLGFGMAENFAWFLSAPTAGIWAVRILERTLYTVIMHAMATGIAGAFFGYTKFRSAGLRYPLRIVGVALAIAAHGYWNYAVSTNGEGGMRIDVLFILLSVAVIFTVLQLSLRTELQILRTELAEEARMGIIPVVHLQYLPYSTKRKFLGWLPSSLNRKQYIELTTRLAFRKYQSRHSGKAARAAYEQDVVDLRSAIQKMLNDDRQSPASRLY